MGEVVRRGPPDLSATVSRFSFRVLRRRYGPAAVNADGFPVAPVVSTTPILMHVHPARGEHLARLPDGIEAANTQQGYTTADLQIGNEQTGQLPDVIEAFGATYEVVERSPWASGASGRRTWLQCLLNEVRRS